MSSDPQPLTAAERAALLAQCWRDYPADASTAVERYEATLAALDAERAQWAPVVAAARAWAVNEWRLKEHKGLLAAVAALPAETPHA